MWDPAFELASVHARVHGFGTSFRITALPRGMLPRDLKILKPCYQGAAASHWPVQRALFSQAETTG